MDSNHRTPVYGRDGLLGRLKDKSASQERNEITIELENGQKVVAPAGLLEQQPDGTYYLPLSRSQVEQAEIVIPLAVEELQVDKHRTTRRIRFSKHVDTRVERVDDAGFKEEVAIEHVAVNQPVETPPAIRTEGDTTIIPVMEEELVIVKRLILREEVHITVKKHANPPVEATVRSERLEIEPPEPDA